VKDDDRRCNADVYHKDTYRYSGRGSSGFTMHYDRERCKRKAGPSGFCFQHDNARWLEVLIKAEKNRRSLKR
jgi:hypothetical protein